MTDAPPSGSIGEPDCAATPSRRWTPGAAPRPFLAQIGAAANGGAPFEPATQTASIADTRVHDGPLASLPGLSTRLDRNRRQCNNQLVARTRLEPGPPAALSAAQPETRSHNPNTAHPNRPPGRRRAPASIRALQTVPQQGNPRSHSKLLCGHPTHSTHQPTSQRNLQRKTNSDLHTAGSPTCSSPHQGICTSNHPRPKRPEACVPPRKGPKRKAGSNKPHM